MTTLSSWILSICIAAVVASIFRLVQPNGNMQKMMQNVIAIFILCVMILPLTGGITFDLDDLDLDLQNEQQVPTNLQNTVENQLKSEMSTQISESVRQSLQKFEIYNAEIYLNINISDDLSISINRLEITIGREHDFKKETVQNYIRQNFYENAEIITN